MASLEVLPISLNLEEIEINRTTFASFNIKNLTSSTISNVNITALDSYVKVKNANNINSSYIQNFSQNLEANDTMTVSVSILPSSDGVNFTTQIRVEESTNNFNQLVSFNFDVYEDLTNYGVIKVHKIIAREGVFSGSTVKVGTGTIKTNSSGNIQTQSAAQINAIKELLETGDTEKINQANLASETSARADRIDDGLVNPITSIRIDKQSNSIIIKTNREESIKVDREGDVFVESSVVLCQDVNNLSENDWKLSRSNDGMTSLLKRMSNEWVTRVSFE